MTYHQNILLQRHILFLLLLCHPGYFALMWWKWYHRYYLQYMWIIHVKNFQINGFQPPLFIMSGQAGKPFGIEAVLKKRYVTHNIVLLFIAAMCPPGYTNFPGYHCYKITPKPQPRDASLRLCQDEGSSLVALETQEEFTALRPWIEEQGD